MKSRGTSKSAASRHLVSQTTKKLEQYLPRRLEEYELAALMMDGLEVAGDGSPSAGSTGVAWKQLQEHAWIFALD